MSCCDRWSSGNQREWNPGWRAHSTSIARTASDPANVARAATGPCRWIRRAAARRALGAARGRPVRPVRPAQRAPWWPKAWGRRRSAVAGWQVRTYREVHLLSRPEARLRFLVHLPHLRVLDGEEHEALLVLGEYGLGRVQRVLGVGRHDCADGTAARGKGHTLSDGANCRRHKVGTRGRTVCFGLVWRQPAVAIVARKVHWKVGEKPVKKKTSYVITINVTVVGTVVPAPAPARPVDLWLCNLTHFPTTSNQLHNTLLQDCCKSDRRPPGLQSSGGAVHSSSSRSTRYRVDPGGRRPLALPRREATMCAAEPQC